ncbi:MAG TPA: hypothetical protein VFL59_12415 [Candidatus Nanopelagicales bacterium]|nr:hypothetical protein [Candidatus Nanopelagicales bacterium]
MTRTLLELVGWTGSALVILSLAQARVLRFRVLNLAGALLATAYNGVLGIWPFAAMNAVIAVIDLYWLRRLLRERHDPVAYSVVEVGPRDAYLAHVVSTHLHDIRRFQPSYALPSDDARRHAYVVQRDAETVGAVVVRDAGEGTAVVELDYVTPRFRDFTPGEFVYRRSGMFASQGIRRLVADDELGTQTEYLARVGFRQEDGAWVREVEQAA